MSGDSIHVASTTDDQAVLPVYSDAMSTPGEPTDTQEREARDLSSIRCLLVSAIQQAMIPPGPEGLREYPKMLYRQSSAGQGTKLSSSIPAKRKWLRSQKDRRVLGARNRRASRKTGWKLTVREARTTGAC
jgi:hypothetical protein